MAFCKYPRTPHLPWSNKTDNEDKILKNTDHFTGKTVVVTIKKDGENTSLYSDHMHARSIDSSNHVSRDWLKAKHSEFKYLIPSGWRICGENLYAKHTLHYRNLNDYFLAFSVWEENNICLSWNETVSFCNQLNIQMVPVYMICRFDETTLRSLVISEFNGDQVEGYVIRNANAFHYDDFSVNVAKYVNENFTIDTKHWSKNAVIKNEIGGVK